MSLSAAKRCEPLRHLTSISTGIYKNHPESNERIRRRYLYPIHFAYNTTKPPKHKSTPTWMLLVYRPKGWSTYCATLK
ncbi:hypothetical protein BV898_19494 [Hypsibius exemplaris]|uniref:Uncharacterized protein n=1 Tax=Hypsibius exemplaris TaxID=2072580 RepID=A0A9X6NJ24_HYPEX|nr:hypothetical protein BV898_19494 [Hypsibius exemplaris]